MKYFLKAIACVVVGFLIGYACMYLFWKPIVELLANFFLSLMFLGT